MFITYQHNPQISGVNLY